MFIVYVKLRVYCVCEIAACAGLRCVCERQAWIERNINSERLCASWCRLGYCARYQDNQEAVCVLVRVSVFVESSFNL